MSSDRNMTETKHEHLFIPNQEKIKLFKPSRGVSRCKLCNMNAISSFNINEMKTQRENIEIMSRQWFWKDSKFIEHCWMLLEWQMRGLLLN